MKKFLFIIILITGLWSINCYAQKGCLVSPLLYPDYSSTGALFEFYDNTNPKPTTAPSCPRVLLGTPTGRSCKFAFLALASYPEYNYTTLNPPTQCPIDDFIPLLLMASGGFGFYLIRKKTNLYLS